MISTTTETITYKAFKLMMEKRVSGLAVVEENSNSLVGQISCTDIREITPNAGLMLLMYLPVKDFLMRRSLDNVSIHLLLLRLMNSRIWISQFFLFYLAFISPIDRIFLYWNGYSRNCYWKNRSVWIASPLYRLIRERKEIGRYDQFSGYPPIVLTECPIVIVAYFVCIFVVSLH